MGGSNNSTSESPGNAGDQHGLGCVVDDGTKGPSIGWTGGGMFDHFGNKDAFGNRMSVVESVRAQNRAFGGWEAGEMPGTRMSNDIDWSGTSYRASIDSYNTNSARSQQTFAQLEANYSPAAVAAVNRKNLPACLVKNAMVVDSAKLRVHDCAQEGIMHLWLSGKLNDWGSLYFVQ